MTPYHNIEYLILKKLKIYSEEIHKNIDEVNYLLSYSGGIDSTVLSSIMLRIKNKYRVNFSLVHFNHQILFNSNTIEKHCINYAATNNLNIYTKRLYFENLDNIEASARNKRYSELDNLIKSHNYDLILTAHHKNDQLETLFMRTIDNSDWLSKIGIRERIGKIRRPLLSIAKNTILDYADNKSVKWIEDISNNNLNIRRNYVRHFQLPVVRNKVYNFEYIMLQSSNMSKLKHDIFINYLSLNKNNIILSNDINNFIINKLHIQKFNIEEIKLFIYNLVANRFNIKISNHSFGFWKEFKKYIVYAKSSAKYIIDDLTFYINRKELIVNNRLHIVKLKRSLLCNNLPWHSGKFIASKNKLCYNNKKNVFTVSDRIFNDGIYIRSWHHGDKMFNSEGQKHTLLSDLFINNKLSIIEKETQPVAIDSNGNIIWIPGLMFGKAKPGNYKAVKYIKWINNINAV